MVQKACGSTAYAYRRNHDRRWQLLDHDGYMGSQTPSVAQTASKYARCVLFVTTASYIPLSSGASAPSIQSPKATPERGSQGSLCSPHGKTGRNLWADSEVKRQSRKVNCWVSAEAPDVV